MKQIEADVNVLHELDDADKILFLKTLLFCSKIDDHVNDEEIRFIKKMGQKYKVDNVKKIFEPTTQEDLLEELTAFQNKKGALELIKNLFLLGYCDHDLTQGEIVFIGRCASSLNVSKEKTEQIAKWVVDFLVLRTQEKLIFNDNA